MKPDSCAQIFDSFTSYWIHIAIWHFIHTHDFILLDYRSWEPGESGFLWVKFNRPAKLYSRTNTGSEKLLEKRKWNWDVEVETLTLDSFGGWVTVYYCCQKLYKVIHSLTRAQHAFWIGVFLVTGKKKKTIGLSWEKYCRLVS